MLDGSTRERLHNGRFLRSGYTTGSCAAGAAQAAARMLLQGEPVGEVQVSTPRGTQLHLKVCDAYRDDRIARCAVRKDAGDDPDVTDGILVYAEVSRIAHGVEIDGGVGVGRVTKPGLDQPVGAAAINSTPRQMIASAVAEVAHASSYEGGLRIIVSVPRGEELAQKTFNPQLGIVDGISILGTSGIVDPMSEAALVDTIRVEISVIAAGGSRDLLVVLGNYGERFAVDELGLSMRDSVKCSNYLGEALRAAAEFGFSRVLVVGHVGKLVKLGIGITNTHSNHADGRMETLCACALLAGAPLEVLRRVLASATTDAALELIDGAGLLDATLGQLQGRVERTLRREAPDSMETGFICFTNDGKLRKVLMESEDARDLENVWRD